MHGTLFLALDKSYAKTSLGARRAAYEHLAEEGFIPVNRFGGWADRMCVAGRASGLLVLLRLRQEQPGPFRKFWKTYCGKSSIERVIEAFKECFPEYTGRVPITRDRSKIPNYGYSFDGMIIDDLLYNALKAGFSGEFEYSFGIGERPCVLYRGKDDEWDWPKDTSSLIGNTWVVVFDYHY